jgi:hypothetical protein
MAAVIMINRVNPTSHVLSTTLAKIMVSGRRIAGRSQRESLSKRTAV